MLLKKRVIIFLLISILSIFTIACVANMMHDATDMWQGTEIEGEVMVLGDQHSVYLDEEKTPLYASDANFDLLDDSWWRANMGCDLEKTSLRRMTNVDVYKKDIYIGTNNYLLENTVTVRSQEASPDNYIIFDNVRAYVRNSRLESACRIYSGGKDTGIAIVENCTFVGDKIEEACIVGMATIARYNIISSQNDGISLDGGLTESSLIEYNWFLGPGKQIKNNHMDGIQIHREGNAVIRYNRFNGYTNSCILLHSAVKPRFGDDPISNVLIDHNLFEVNGLAWYYLYVCEYERDVQEESLKRPRMITITNNIFEEDKNNRVMPIYTGLTKADTAMFVKTEEEREEGISNQKEHPEVLDFRKGLGYADSAVDARSWIVWNGNTWKNSGEVVEPGDGKGGPGGWYHLKGENTFLKESTDAS